MELVVLGSGTCVPSLRRNSSGYFLRIGQKNILIDGGTGTLRRLLEAGESYKTIHYILYSHFHPDHVMELVPFLFATKHTPGFTRTEKLTIVGPRGLVDFYRRLAENFADWIVSPYYDLELRETWTDTIDLGDFRIRTTPVNHSITAIGYRIEDSAGHSLTYSGDTDLCSEIIDLAKETDLLVLECSFPDDMKVEGHLTPSLAGTIAQKARCRKLLLTHFYPPCDSIDIPSVVQKVYSGEILLAEDLLRLTVP